MRQRGRGAEKNQRAAMKTHFRETRFDEVRDVLLRHAFFKGGKCGAEDIEGGAASEAHQLQFMRGFVRTASDGDRVAGAAFKSRTAISQMIEKCEAGGFFNPNAA